MTGDDRWWVRILANELLTAKDHIRIAEELMAFSERTAETNPGKGYSLVTYDTERAMVHATIALAIAQAK